MPKLTELDYCVLGVVWRHGPVSAYGVRKVFRDSTTASWSASSGSIYPSIRRLLAAGLATAGAPEDKRGTQSIVIANDGLNELRAWILDLRPEHGTATPDPIRTRSQFITSISHHDRAEFVEAAQRVTSDALHILQGMAGKNARETTPDLEQLGTLGSISELEARLEWLKSVAAVRFD
jgi:DNA-binding PadR family transcriptional regulator